MGTHPHMETHARTHTHAHTGFSFKDGLHLPGPRKNLGVQFWHRGVPDKFFCLIPTTLGVPCSATQLFTTLHDDQEQACIHIYYGVYTMVCVGVGVRVWDGGGGRGGGRT